MVLRQSSSHLLTAPQPAVAQEIPSMVLFYSCCGRKSLISRIFSKLIPETLDTGISNIIHSVNGTKTCSETSAKISKMNYPSDA